MKIIKILLLIILFSSCQDFKAPKNNYNTNTAGQEQNYTENNQKRLLNNQPPPNVNWSMERDALTMRFKMMNNRGIIFYMYVFNYGIQDPIGYYQVNKVSSVNSQLTNTEQLIISPEYDTPGEWNGRTAHILPSPAEDGLR